MMIHSHRYLVLAWLFILFSACDNTIEPLVESENETFAIHGFLDMRTDHQMLRVEALRPNILADPVSLGGVEVIATDHTSNGIHIWRDSLITLDDGSPGVVFIADFTPKAGHSYTLQISRNGAPSAHATTTIPTVQMVRVNEAKGDSLTLKQKIVLIGISDAPFDVFLNYSISPPGESAGRTLSLAYGDPGFSSDDGWEFYVDLATDRFILLNLLGLDSSAHGVSFRGVTFSLTLFSQEWKRISLGENLVNAHGFFGSVGVFEHEWVLDSSIIQILGFVDEQNRN